MNILIDDTSEGTNGFLMISSAFSSLIIILIKFYQLFISPLLGSKLPFLSNLFKFYSIEAFKKYGFLKRLYFKFKENFQLSPIWPLWV